MKKRPFQSGNVLIFILIAVFLLGALTAMLAKTSSTTEETGEKERASISASDMMDYAAGMKAAVQKLVMNGCSENEISFYSTKWDTPADYDNPRTPAAGTNFSCHVFNIAGGGMDLKDFNDDIPLDQMSFVANRVSDEWVSKELGTTASDLTMIMRVDGEACKRINKALSNGLTIWESSGIHNGSLQEASDAWNVHDPFIGDYAATNPLNYGYDNIGGVDYAYEIPPGSGCFCDGPNVDCTPPAKFYFYTVLLKR